MRQALRDFGNWVFDLLIMIGTLALLYLALKAYGA